MIDEQQPSADIIDESEITHQMFGRNVGFVSSENRRLRTNPFDGRLAMLPLEVVERLDCRNNFNDFVAHWIRHLRLLANGLRR